MSGWFNYTKEMVSAVEKYSNVIHVLFEDLKLVNRIINVHRRKLTQLNEEKNHSTVQSTDLMTSQSYKKIRVKITSSVTVSIFVQSSDNGLESTKSRRQ